MKTGHISLKPIYDFIFEHEKESEEGLDLRFTKQPRIVREHTSNHAREGQNETRPTSGRRDPASARG